MRPIRTALVGCGFVASNEHLPAIAACADFELVAVADIDPVTVKDRAEKYHCRAYTDLVTMLDQEKPELLVITTAEKFHHDMTLAAAERGIHVFCEKPLATNTNDARHMVEVMAAKNLVFAVDFIYRFENCVEAIRRAMAERDLGTLELIRFHGLWDFHGIYGNPARRLRNLEYGTLACGIHDVDLIQFVSGQDIATLYCVGHFPEKTLYRPPATVLIGGTLTGGALWSADASAAVGRACKNRVLLYRYELFFDRGHVSWHREYGVPTVFKVRDDTGTHVQELPHEGKPFNRAYPALAERIRKGRAFTNMLATGEEGLRNQIICDRANALAESGGSLHPVPL